MRVYRWYVHTLLTVRFPLYPPNFQIAITRWGNSGFTEYVKLLEKQADEVLQMASEIIQNQAQEAFLNIAKLE